MNEITPTATEYAAERFGVTTLQRAVTALHADGFVVINDIIGRAHLDRLRERMTDDLATLRALPVVPHNFVWGNVQQNPPPDAGLVFRGVVSAGNALRTGAGVRAGVRGLPYRQRHSAGAPPAGPPGRQSPLRVRRAQLSALNRRARLTLPLHAAEQHALHDQCHTA